MISSTFPLPDAFCLLFFHVKLPIPGSLPAFMSSVCQVEELLELFPIGKFFLAHFQKKTTKILTLFGIFIFSQTLQTNGVYLFINQTFV